MNIQTTMTGRYPHRLIPRHVVIAALLLVLHVVAVAQHAAAADQMTAEGQRHSSSPYEKEEARFAAWKARFPDAATLKSGNEVSHGYLYVVLPSREKIRASHSIAHALAYKYAPLLSDLESFTLLIPGVRRFRRKREARRRLKC